MQRGDYKGVPVQDTLSKNAKEGQQEIWMSIPVGVPNCPSGLEYLTAIDQLLIKQKVELTEVLSGFETNNKYKVKNALGQNIYMAIEENDCVTRCCLGNIRPFNMKILDNFHNEVLHIYRPLKCGGCCFPSCLHELEVSSPPGNVIGMVKQEWSCWKPKFVLKNAAGDNVLRIIGPACQLRCCSDIEFHVFTMNGEEIGKITKQWGESLREFFTDADYFGVTFPLDLEVRMKALVFAATFLIDFLFFENS